MFPHIVSHTKSESRIFPLSRPQLLLVFRQLIEYASHSNISLFFRNKHCILIDMDIHCFQTILITHLSVTWFRLCCFKFMVFCGCLHDLEFRNPDNTLLLLHLKNDYKSVLTHGFPLLFNKKSHENIAI